MTVIRKYVLAWDFVVALALSLGLAFANWAYTSEKFRSVLEILISIDSILFGIFFAAFSMIASSASDDFILFVQDRGNVFRIMLNDFRFVLSVLVVSLMLFLLFRLALDTSLKTYIYRYRDLSQSIVSFFIFYSILSCANLSYQVIHFSRRRVDHLERQRDEKSDPSET